MLRKCLRDRDAPHSSELDSNAMNQTAHGEKTPTEILTRSIEHDRVHSAYLLTGSGRHPTEAAETFARALVCQSGSGAVCEQCDACRRSRAVGADGAGNADGTPIEPIVLDGKGKRGPTYRHLGDHPDLFWIERGRDDTRITIGQVRDLQIALRRGANEGGRRAAVIDEAHRQLCLDLIYDRGNDNYDPLMELITAFEGVTVAAAETVDIGDLGRRGLFAVRG